MNEMSYAIYNRRIVQIVLIMGLMSITSTRSLKICFPDRGLHVFLFLEALMTYSVNPINSAKAKDI